MRVSSGLDAHRQALLEGIPHLIWQSWDSGEWSAASPQWTAYTGQSEGESKKFGWRQMIHADDWQAIEEAWRTANESGVLMVDHRIKRHDGAYRWFQTRALPVSIYSRAAAARTWVGTSTDVDDLRVAESRIRYLAFHDVLTGTGNRAMLKEVLERMAPESTPPEPFNILYLDVDDFKLVNDHLGHRGADEVLCAISRQLGGWLREGDTVARVGGDEFVVVQTNATAAEGVSLANRIKVGLGAPLTVGAQECRVGVSVGLASSPEDGTAADELLRRADLALFAAKAAGRGRLRRYDPAMDTARQERLILQTGLVHAIERNEMSLAYQAIWSADTRTVHSYEALARWTHPQRGAVSPDAFIPVAEESGIISALGEWVLTRACLDAADPALERQKVAINLSPAQFRSGTLTRTVMDVLDQTGLAPDRLELEVTERLLMDSDGAVDRTLREIKAAGVAIALDDFGTGYSNLGYLCRFPLDRLKIDKSFVRQMSEDDGARAVVGGIIALAHSLQMLVTAEGVETEEQLAILRDMGCDQIQGYLLGRPMPLKALQRLSRQAS